MPHHKDKPNKTSVFAEGFSEVDSKDSKSIRNLMFKTVFPSKKKKVNNYDFFFLYLRLSLAFRAEIITRFTNEIASRADSAHRHNGY